jgi:GPH family glycoside/pentoside/hexuronide:cation symporter
MLIMKNYDVTEERANEIRSELDKRKKVATPHLTSYYQTGKLLSLGSFSLGSKLNTDTDFTKKSNKEIKELFSRTLNDRLHGLCFSPYTEGQDIGDILSEKQIRRRMDIIAPYTNWVRSFSCTDGNEYVQKVAHEKGIKAMVGAWIGHDKAQNEKEIKALIKSGQEGYVDIAVVGNEVLMRNELTEEEMIGYISRIKEALPNIPVGYVDAYYQFIERPKLIDVCDIILINCYPFWEGCSVDEASQYLNQMYTVTKNVAKGKPVIITETGWPNEGSKTGNAIPSAKNAMKYFININNLAKQKDIKMFYFSSFDESWKVHHEGDVGERWGIWDKYEKLKYK